MEEDVEMSGLKIREFKPSDYGPFSVIHDSLYPAHPFFLESSFVARHDDEYVGSSTLLRTAKNDVLDQGFTAVRPDLRGRGIAQVVKLRVAEHAKKIGVRLLITNNDSRNGPMLAVNRKLGFVKQNEWVTFQKEIASIGATHTIIT